jgi:hypothetical protein
LEAANMDDHTTYEDQIDPALLARVEAWRAEQQRQLPEDDETGQAELDALADLMCEPAGGRNFGTGDWGGSPPGSDPEEPRFGDSTPKHPDRHRRELDYELFPDLDNLASNSWNIEYVVTGRPNGRPPVWPTGVPERVQRQLIEAVGTSREDFKRLTRKGGKTRTPEEVAARTELGLRLGRVMRAGRGKGVEEALLATYGCNHKTLYRLASLARPQREGNP